MGLWCGVQAVATMDDDRDGGEGHDGNHALLMPIVRQTDVGAVIPSLRRQQMTQIRKTVLSVGVKTNPGPNLPTHGPVALAQRL